MLTSELKGTGRNTRDILRRIDYGGTVTLMGTVRTRLVESVIALTLCL